MSLLLPGFQIYPHGIKKLAGDGQPHAIFKLVLSVRNLDAFATKSRAAQDTWTDFIDSANNGFWQYLLKGTQLAFSRDEDVQNAIKFNIYALNGDCVQSANPHFGKFMETAESQLSDSWSFMKANDTDFVVVDMADRDDKKLRQFVEKNLMIDRAANKNRDEGEREVDDPFTRILKKADNRAGAYNDFLNRKKQRKEKISSDSRGGGLKASVIHDFKAIFGASMKEPVAAEYRMGLVREFSIPVNKLMTGTDVKLNYTIRTEYDDPEEGESYLLLKKGNKYYNGNSKYFFLNTKTDFAEVLTATYDPYKDRLEGKSTDKPHPEGIFCLIKYNEHEKTGFIKKDPFNAPGINGFNVVVHDGQSYESLSPHKKVVHFRKYCSVTVPLTSGSITARGELLTNDGRYRNNVLFAWRGDNLMVNRNDKPIEDSKNQADYIRSIPVSETTGEDAFVGKELFYTEEYLVNSSLPQLISRKNYSFFVRSVSPLQYYLPLQKELKENNIDSTYILTVEDFATQEQRFCSIKPEFTDPSVLPIKSPSIVGLQKYDKGNENVDNEQHIVLDEFKNERIEMRFIYPPKIKWADFRLLGYLGKEKISRRANEEISRDEFIDNCIWLEDKSEINIPPYSLGRKNVQYVSDPRCTEVYVTGADLFTINRLDNCWLSNGAFNITAHFPFFDDLHSVELCVVNDGQRTRVTINGITLMNTEVGIYNFKIYTVDNSFTNSAEKCKELLKYNATPLRISILNKPAKVGLKAGEFQAPVTAMRILPSTISPNQKDLLSLWILTLPLNKESTTWRSIKYFEENTVFKLPRDGFKNLYQDFITWDQSTHYELLKNEYPYEMFLIKEGSINAKEGLRTEVFPRLVTIDIATSHLDLLTNVPELFSIRLNGIDQLIAKIENMNIVLVFGGATQATGSAFQLRIYYDANARHKYVLEIVGNTILELNKFISPEISIADFKICDEVLNHIQHYKSTYIKFKRSDDFQVTGDLKSAFYCRKKIRLFASSQFQAYYPRLTSEFPLGTLGPVADIEIPNNVKPSVPKIEAKILLRHAKAEFWNASGIKQNISEQMVQLLMDDDFCQEGPNKIGIVLARYDGKGHALLNDENMSEIGEDITKLTDTNWYGKRITDLINLTGQPAVLDKYYPDKQTKFYSILGDAYEVLEAVPFFNSNLKKWQIVVPFRFFERSETIFIKFITVKIARGHGMELLHPNQPNSSINPYLDPEATNISAFSKSAQLPIYSRKIVTITRTLVSFKIKIESKSDYDGKIYCVMLFRKVPEGNILNYKPAAENEKYQDWVSYKLLGDPSKSGKILMFAGNKEIEILKENCACLMVLEFERHENFEKPEWFNNLPAFINTNPLFEVKGLRLINAEEFVC